MPGWLHDTGLIGQPRLGQGHGKDFVAWSLNYGVYAILDLTLGPVGYHGCVPAPTPCGAHNACTQVQNYEYRHAAQHGTLYNNEVTP